MPGTRRYRCDYSRSESLVDVTQGEESLEVGVHIVRPSSSREELGGPCEASLEAVRRRAFGSRQGGRRRHVSAHEALRAGGLFGKAVGSDEGPRHRLTIAPMLRLSPLHVESTRMKAPPLVHNL